MELGFARLTRFVAVMSLGVIAMAATVHMSTTVHAGGFNGGFNRAVGGVIVDASGIVRTATVEEKIDLANVMRGVVDQPQGDMAEKTDMRMISLAKLQDAIVESRKSGAPLPESISFLAGLQRVEYVFVDKANNDIVIAGPAEPWELQDDGSVVGKFSGKSVLRLEDLVVAMRSVETARKGGISCSIEPTAEGRRRLQQLMRNIKLRPGQNPSIYEESMKQAFGPQTINVSGVPMTSSYARTLVAADYEMKRLAMELADSPIKELPSYLQMAKNGRHNAAQNPRWWMACNYDALTRSEDKTAWKINGQGVKTMTEQDVIAEDGTAKGNGRQDKTAVAWAEKMTENYAKLSEEISVFGDLRNVMDLTVVSTLIVQENLAKRAGLDLSVLYTSDDIELVEYQTPKAVSPQCSFVRGRSGWTVTASGGVDINAFSIVEKQESDKAMDTVRTQALAASTNDRWWWNK